MPFALHQHEPVPVVEDIGDAAGRDGETVQDLGTRGGSVIAQKLGERLLPRFLRPRFW
jgi:hypothetical protein